MAFLKGYFDESGSSDSSHLVVAGFIAEAEHWLEFNNQWAAALRDYSVPFFKAQWFNKRKKFFQSWDENRQRGFMGRLLTAIRNAKTVPVACAVPVVDYDEIVKPGKIRNKIGSAYTLCAAQCFRYGGKWATKRGYTEPVEYVFDAGHKNKGEFGEAHQKFWNGEDRQRFLLGGLSFRDDQQVLPLQSADLLAYEMTQYLSGYVSRHPMSEIQEMGSEDYRISRATLEKMVADHCG
jgi:hypothetical protein